MRLKLLFTIVFINYINTFGQELNQSEWLWEINVENTAVMVGQPLGFVDKNNNHFLVGNFMGASTEVQGITIQNSSTPATTPVADAFIAKFDENGVLLNVIHFEGTRYEVITSVEYDGENHYFITGSFNGTMQLDGTTVLENTDVSVSKTFIAKFNLNGQLVWSKIFDGFIGSGHLKYKNEHLYLAGNYAPDQFSFENTTLPQTNYTPSIIGMGKVLVAKFMANDGSLEWVSSSQYTGPYTSSSSDRIGSQIKAITVDTNGSVYIAGDFFSKSVTFGNTTLTRSSNTNANLYFVKYTSNGTVDWAKTATTTASADSKIFDIAVDTANDLYLTGIAYNTTINFDGTPLQFPGNYGGFLVKYNATGNLLWAKKGGISTNQAPKPVLVLLGFQSFI